VGDGMGIGEVGLCGFLWVCGQPVPGEGLADEG
jgi:hypothetical protein